MTNRILLDSIGFEKAQKKLEAADDILLKHMYALLKSAAGIAQREIVEQAPLGSTNDLKRSVMTSSVIQEGADLAIYVGSNLQYAPFVEYGTKPHRPPIAPLIRWVEAKIGVSNTNDTKKIAFAIAAKIEKHGTKGQYFFKKGLEIAEKQYGFLADQQQKRFISEIIGDG